MPLPPLPENNTARAWLKYTSVGVEHELMFRPPNGTSLTDVGVMATTLANGLKSQMQTSDSFTGLRYSAQGSTLSFPLAWTPIAGTGSTSSDADNKAKFEALSGRSSGGYRCRMTFFTPNLPDSQQYRNNGATGFYTLVTSITPTFRAIDGLGVIWNSYTNLGYNAYWQRQFR